MLIGSPVGRDAQVLGAVVVVAPTDEVRSDVLVRLLVLGGLGAATLLLAACGVVVPAVGWVLRPVHALDVTAKRLSSGDMDARASETGPTELRDLAHTFNGMADSVQASRAQQRELVADAAHQLGNPLTALRLRVENLASEGVDRDDIEPVLEETDRLSATVESLLHLSRVGVATVTRTRVDVAAIVRHRCEMWAPVFDRLTVHAPPEAPALATVEVLDTALDALLDNAAKFAPGSPVEVTVTPAGGSPFVADVRVRVVDHGPGLHPDDPAKVGARFFRGRTHQNVQGTGLGLAIVRAPDRVRR
ncbi:HAMP domain-containing sensor histidine kinase [Janibacter limosus]|uniref:HAMP domain-containing histidine kinase n=1 Tax=Janibacter limosus TaxID=53458 RepID=A0AC61U2G0_9MICO|nr:HAMP domain-containing sensor histidine kinase [Janibacter limosus]UUZ44197.1 HAMP domain-containing sensor histidine kinase [Janibacter limosus]